MRTFIVTIGCAAVLAAPLAAQQPGPAPGTGSSFYISPYAGYVWYGDLFDFGNDVEFSNDDGALWGLQAGYSFTPTYSLIGHFGYNRSNFELEENGTTIAATGDFNVYMYDANIQFRTPFFMDWGAVAPLGQLGIGAITYDFDTDVFDQGSSTDWAFNFGIGADFQFTREFGVRLLLKDYITSLAWEDSDVFEFDEAVEDNVAHNWSLSVGLNFGF